MRLGSIKSVTINGYTIATQADGEAKIMDMSVVVTPLTTGNGRILHSGELKSGEITIPCYLFLEDLQYLNSIIMDTPDEGYTCTMTLISGEVWRWQGTVLDQVEGSLKEGKSDVKFSCYDLSKI